MPIPHHGRESQNELWVRFQQQKEGSLPRSYPDGRLNGYDDGELSYCIGTDVKRGKIVVQFPVATQWIAMTLESATALRDQLSERLIELRGITVRDMIRDE